MTILKNELASHLFQISSTLSTCYIEILVLSRCWCYSQNAQAWKSALGSTPHSQCDLRARVLHGPGQEAWETQKHILPFLHVNPTTLWFPPASPASSIPGTIISHFSPFSTLPLFLNSSYWLPRAQDREWGKLRNTVILRPPRHTSLLLLEDRALSVSLTLALGPADSSPARASVSLRK